MASSSEITISEATPTYSLTFSPSTIQEGQTATWTLTTSNVATGTTLYFYNPNTSGAVVADIAGGAQWMSVTTAGNVTTGTITAAYDSEVETTNERLTWNVFQSQNSGNTVLATGYLYIKDALGKIGGLSLTHTGGSSIGSATTLELQITSIAAYPLSRTFNIGYVLDGQIRYSGLSATSITVPANSTSSSKVTVYSTSSSTALASLYFFTKFENGHEGKNSNQLNNIWL